MKNLIILFLSFSISFEKIIEVDFLKGISSIINTKKNLTIIISLEDLPEETSGIINIFTEKENSLNPIYKKFSKKKSDAEKIEEEEDDNTSMKIETFVNGKRFRLPFRKTSSKNNYLSISFETLKDTKIYIPPSKSFLEEEITSVHEIFTKEHTIKSQNPIYYKISLKSLSEYNEEEVSKKYHSQITFFSDGILSYPQDIYVIDESIDSFNLHELILMEEDTMIMEIYSENDIIEHFDSKHSKIEYYESLIWEPKGVSISTHQIISGKENDIHKFLLNKDYLISNVERYFVNIVHLIGKYNIDYHLYGDLKVIKIEYNKEIHKGNNLLYVNGTSSYVFNIECLSRVCLFNFELIKTSTDKITDFKFDYYNKYYYIYVEKTRTINLDASTDDYISALNNGNYKLKMHSKKSIKEFDAIDQVNEFFPISGNEIEIIVKKPTLFFIFHTNLIEKNPYDNFKDYFNSITLKYTFTSHEEHGSVPYYLFKQPLNIDVFHFNHHDKTIVGKIYHFRNELSFEFYNPYLHYDSDVDTNEFAFSSCFFEKNLKEEGIDISFNTQESEYLELKEISRIRIKEDKNDKFLLLLDDRIRNETISDYNLVLIIYAAYKSNATITYSISDYIDFQNDIYEKTEKIEFDKNGRCVITIPNIILAKGIKFDSNFKGKILFYYTYMKKSELFLTDRNRFKIDVINYNNKEINLQITPFLKTIGIDSEYKVYKIDFNETRNDLGKLIKTNPILIFNDKKHKNDKIDFNVPIEGRKKYYIAIYAYSLQPKTQFNQTIYLPLEFDPDKVVLPNKFIFYSIIILIICIGVYYLCFKNKKNDNIKLQQQELQEIDNYNKL